MKTFIRGWEYEPPALQDFVGLVFILAFIGQLVFKGGPVADVLLGVLVFCCMVIIVANRSWEHMTPHRWALVTAILVTTLVDYVVDTPVTHTVQRTVTWVFMVWFIANRPHIRRYWRDAEPSDGRL
jgi:hypothetical protein